MSIRRTTLTCACAGIALTGTLVLGGAPAFADATPAGTATAAPSATATPAHSAAERQAKAVCDRAPKVQQRITKALNRLNGPAGERGSIARLEKRVSIASGANQTAITTYLNNRLTTRKGLLTTLTARQSDLHQVQTWCSANGIGKAS